MKELRLIHPHAAVATKRTIPMIASHSIIWRRNTRRQERAKEPEKTYDTHHNYIKTLQSSAAHPHFRTMGRQPSPVKESPRRNDRRPVQRL